MQNLVDEIVKEEKIWLTEFIEPINELSDKTKCEPNSRKRLCSDLDCKACFERSFASSEFVIYWYVGNEISPRFVTKGNIHKYKFICLDCGKVKLLSLRGVNQKSLKCECPKKTLNTLGTLDNFRSLIYKGDEISILSTSVLPKGILSDVS